MVFRAFVRVEVKDIDRYGRLVAIITLPDGRVLNEELLKAGMAWVYRRYCHDQRYYDMELHARERQVGLWADAEPVAPWEWRRDRVRMRDSVVDGH